MSQVFCIYMQNGSSDCGLYAVIFATSIAFGEDPTTLRFRPESMRQHLFKCLQAGKMEPFPPSTVNQEIFIQDFFGICNFNFSFLYRNLM